MKTDVDELRERLEPHVAERKSEEGQQVIQDTGSARHIYIVWEDGEVNNTKGGDVFMNRSLFVRCPAFLDEDLWDVPEGAEHKFKVVLDKDKVEEIITDYTDKWRL